MSIDFPAYDAPAQSVGLTGWVAENSVARGRRVSIFYPVNGAALVAQPIAPTTTAAFNYGTPRAEGMLSLPNQQRYASDHLED